jgi:hypothetical protein
VAFASELLHEHLEGACQELLSFCAGNTPANGLSQKNHLLSLVSRIRGVVAGLGSSLPDFEPPGTVSTSDNMVTCGQVWFCRCIAVTCYTWHGSRLSCLCKSPAM